MFPDNSNNKSYFKMLHFFLCYRTYKLIHNNSKFNSSTSVKSLVYFPTLRFFRRLFSDYLCILNTVCVTFASAHIHWQILKVVLKMSLWQNSVGNRFRISNSSTRKKFAFITFSRTKDVKVLTVQTHSQRLNFSHVNSPFDYKLLVTKPLKT